MIFKKGQKIVFAGDSVTDDGRARPVGEGLWDALGNGYVKLIDTFFSVDYPELYLRCVNMGISGNTSRDLLKRWDTDVNALNPDYVVVAYRLQRYLAAVRLPYHAGRSRNAR